MRLWVKGARQVVRVVANGQPKLAGPAQRDCDLAIIEESDGVGVSIVVDDEGLIAAVGRDDQVERDFGRHSFDQIIDATGCAIVPGLIDAHTHPVWAGDRVHEFAMKLAGATYMDIYRSGGGIHFTVEHTRAATEDELYTSLRSRLMRMMKNGKKVHKKGSVDLGGLLSFDRPYLANAIRKIGTVLVEGKSGYGLDTANEMKMLRTLERAKKELPIDISSTFCGAHAVPRGQTSQEATDNILNEQIPELKRLQASGELSVDSIDVFCEKGVFDLDQSRRILEAGRAAGLRLNFHADELTPLGGAEMGAGLLGAEAMSHLEEISPAGIESMAQKSSVAVILPTTAYLLRLKPPPVRDLINQGVPVALGSDFNPNAYCLSMPLVMNLACILCRMTLAESLVAATINAAAALGKQATHGSLEQGKFADFLILKTPRWEHLIYQMGDNDQTIDKVIKKGRVVTF